jgi:IPT/TIG domain
MWAWKTVNLRACIRPAIILLFSGVCLAQAVTGSIAGPRIESISPASGTAGSRVIITGNGLTDDNAIYFGTTTIRHVRSTAIAGIACTTDPNCHSGIVQTLEIVIPNRLARGTYRVVVENETGKSEAYLFHVTR